MCLMIGAMGIVVVGSRRRSMWRKMKTKKMIGSGGDDQRYSGWRLLYWLK